MSIRIGKIELHFTSGYEREKSEPRFWTAMMGNSRWTRFGNLMVIASQS